MILVILGYPNITSIIYTYIRCTCKDSSYIMVWVGSGWSCLNSCKDSSQGTSGWTTWKSATVVETRIRFEFQVPRPIFDLGHTVRTRDPIVLHRSCADPYSTYVQSSTSQARAGVHSMVHSACAPGAYMAVHGRTNFYFKAKNCRRILPVLRILRAKILTGSVGPS